MPRGKMQRIVHRPPFYTEFKPVGVRVSELEPVELTLDEFEAIRLADKVGMNHNTAAEEMEISRSTFSRLIEKARKKIAEFLIEGKQLQIDGGNIHFRNNVIKCNSCGRMFNTSFNKEINKCPACGSDNLVDLAGGFGHGRCCRNSNISKEVIMPGGDRTGPNGNGPRTGRGLGKAAGNNMGRGSNQVQRPGQGQGQEQRPAQGQGRNQGQGQGRNR